jgi:hypothetical protein
MQPEILCANLQTQSTYNGVVAIPCLVKMIHIQDILLCIKFLTQKAHTEQRRTSLNVMNAFCETHPQNFRIKLFN